MRSGNGRHRRPRQAPAIVVTAGVTGSALAMPLFAATGAHAADAGTWDRVAQCESGGLWSANSGNGFYGGLQLTQQMWEEHGGLDYAPRPDLASRSEQIAVAEKLLAAKGPDAAFPSCALSAGLTDDDENPDVDPGALIDLPGTVDGLVRHLQPVPPGDDASAGSGQSDSGEGSDSGTGSDASEDADASSPASSAGKHRGEPADENADGKKDAEGRESGRHASRGGGSDGAREPADGSYTVRTGDSLSAIADAHSVHGGWTALYDANKKVIGDNPDLILPGQHLDLDADHR